MANVNIKGLESLMAKLDALGGNVEEALKDGIDLAARHVKRDAKLLCPADTGGLRNSIQSRVEQKDGKILGVVYTNKEYAAYVEFGTGQRGEQAQIVRPEGISYRFDWAGMKPQPYLYPALIQNKPKIKGYIASSLQKAIRKVAK